MNDATAVPAPRAAPVRPSTPLRRALGVEWHQHRGLLALYGAVAVIVILLAGLLDVPFGVVAILLAARLPTDLADQVPVDGRMLRSSLGISRADAIRARFLLVTGGQLMLAIAAACGRRPTGARAIALFLGVCLLTYLVLMATVLLTGHVLMTAGTDGLGGSRFVAAATVAQSVALALTLGGGITVLGLNRRRWIRRA